jgi:hypothetical protein
MRLLLHNAVDNNEHNKNYSLYALYSYLFFFISGDYKVSEVMFIREKN